LLVPVAAAALIQVIIRVVASFFAEPRLWGVNQGAYIYGSQLLYLVFMGLILFAYLQKDRVLRSKSQIGKHDPDDRRAGIVFLILGVSYVAALYFFSVKEIFLGDGYSLISALANPDLGLKPRAYGEMYLHRLWLETTDNFSAAGAYQSYRYLSIGASVVYFIFVLYYARRLTASRFARFGFVLLLMTLPSSLLFFGYVENYSLLTCALTVFLLSAVQAVKSGSRSPTPLIAYGMALFLHGLSLVYLPVAVLYLVWLLKKHKIAEILDLYGKNLVAAMTIAIVGLYAIIMTIGPLSWRLTFLPPWAGRFTVDNYYLLSTGHLLDYINLLLFVLPVPLTVLVVYLFQNRGSSRRELSAGGRTENGLLAVGSLCGLLLAFLIYPRLTMARDWDFLSVLLLGAIFHGLYWWIDFMPKLKGFRAATVVLILLQLSVTIPWIMLNNSPRALYEYNMDAMERDPRHGRAGFQTMLAYNRGHGRTVEAARLELYIRDNLPETDDNHTGLNYLYEGEIEKAERQFEKALTHNPAFFAPYMHRAICRMERGDWEGALNDLDIADAINPYSSDVYAFRGLALLGKADSTAALESWRRSIESNSANPVPYIRLISYYSGQSDDSVRYYVESYPGLAGASRIYFDLSLNQISLESLIARLNEFETEANSSDSGFSRRLARLLEDLRGVRSRI